MEAEKLIEEAKGLIGVSPSSPRYLLWRNRTEAYVGKNYDDKTARILQKCLRPSRVFSSQHDLQMDFNERIERTIEFLNEIKSTPPPSNLAEEKVGAESLESLHPILIKKCSSLYKNDEFVAAVERGFKVVRDRLRELTDFETGSDAFGRGRLYIRGAAADNVDDAFQQAVKFLTMAIDQFRNEKVHTSDGNIDNALRAYEYLSLSSLAMHLLDSSEIKNT